MTSRSKTPTVFVSYRHENDSHRERVRGLAQRLQDKGVAVVLDQMFLERDPGGPDEGWPAWSMDQAKRADLIVIVASDGWFRCYEGKESAGIGLGAAAEGFILRTRLYNDRVNRIARIVSFGPIETRSLPLELQPYHHFDVEKDFAALVGWLKGRAPSAAAAPDLAGWPEAPPTLAWEPADCVAVRKAFGQMIAAGARQRVLLVRGATETGKTHLTRHLNNVVLTHGAIACGRLDIKMGADLQAEFNLFVAHLGVDDAVKRTAGAPVRARLDEVMQELRGRRRATLLVFDTFEQGGEWARWIEDQALAEIPRAPWLRVVIAGQRVPAPAGTAWEPYAGKVIELKQLGWKDWYRYGRQYKPHLSETFARELHKEARGQHGLLASVMRTK